MSDDEYNATFCRLMEKAMPHQIPELLKMYRLHCLRRRDEDYKNGLLKPVKLRLVQNNKFQTPTPLPGLDAHI